MQMEDTIYISNNLTIIVLTGEIVIILMVDILYHIPQMISP